MNVQAKFAHVALLSCALHALTSHAADAPADPIAVKAIAEIETRVSRHGTDAVQLQPVKRVVPGDQIVYTLEIRNTGAAAVPAPSVSYAIPEHMAYIADSAAGPGAVVSFSVDGGHTFDRPDNLKVAGPEGQLRAATAADYTHIRWQLRHPLKADSVAFARFRTLVK